MSSPPSTSSLSSSSSLAARVRAAAALVSGTVFGAGLAIAGMTDPRRVLAFLDPAGAWDPSLAFVLGGAVLTAFVGFRVLRARGGPSNGAAIESGSAPGIDRALLVGSAVFGIGWGLAGYCPGPAIASLAWGNAEAAWFAPAMLAAAGWQRRARRRGRL